MRLNSSRTRMLLAATVGLAGLGVSTLRADASVPPTEPADSSASSDDHGDEAAGPLVLTYDGGLLVVDGTTLDVIEDVPLEGFNRVNAAGDDSHVFVSTAEGFVLLDAVTPALTEQVITADLPGHVVRHAGHTVLFADGTGEVTIIDAATLGDEPLEPEEVYQAAEPHHGVAVLLANGELVLTVGTEEERTGMVALDAERNEIARSEECPGVHGEAPAADEAVVAGCHDGVLVYHGGAFTKVTSPDADASVGTAAGSPDSAVVLTDYSPDPDVPSEQVALVNTEDATMSLVDLGTSYTFRSLGRGPHGEALVLGTDGSLHVIDPDSGEIVSSIPVVAEWTEPEDWQEPRPALFVSDHTAYITEPATSSIHAVDIVGGAVISSAELPATPNELSGVLPAH